MAAHLHQQRRSRAQILMRQRGSGDGSASDVQEDRAEDVAAAAAAVQAAVRIRAVRQAPLRRPRRSRVQILTTLRGILSVHLSARAMTGGAEAAPREGCRGADARALRTAFVAVKFAGQDSLTSLDSAAAHR